MVSLNCIFFPCWPGIGAGFWYLVGVWVMYRIKVDDVVMAAPTHLFCGTWGALAVGFFATKHGIKDTYNIKQPLGHGIFYGGNGKQLAVQVRPRSGQEPAVLGHLPW